jgi:hypothetical protein
MSADDALERLRQKSKTLMARRIAYHEAGHAVVAHVYGRELVSISLDEGQTVVRDERSEAILNGTDPVSPSDEAHVLQSIKIALAGHLGEIVGLGDAHPASASKDIKKASAMLKRLRGRVPTGLGLQDEVQAELIGKRDVLVRVAEALLAERRLGRERLTELMVPK